MITAHGSTYDLYVLVLAESLYDLPHICLYLPV